MKFLFLFLSILLTLNFVTEQSLAESKIVTTGSTIELKDDQETHLSKLNIKLGSKYSKKAASAYCLKTLNAAKCWSSASVSSYQAAEEIMKSHDESQAGNEVTSTMWKKISQNAHLCSEYFARAGEAFEVNNQKEGETFLKCATSLSEENKQLEQNLTQKVTSNF